MVSRCRRLVVLCAVLQFNEAFGSVRTTWKIASKAEIEANMTSEDAARTVLGMKRTSQDPEFLALIRSRFGSLGRRGPRVKEQAQLQVGLRGTTNPTGYSGVDKAHIMLNDMTSSSQTDFDESVVTCNRYDRLTTTKMESMRQKVLDYNADAAHARGRVIYAQGQIATLTTQLTQTVEDFERHKKNCIEELNEYNRQLKIVEGDLEVMGVVLDLTDCGGQDQNSTAGGFLLVQCRQCNDAIYLQHSKIAKLLGKLQSNIAKQSVQSSLEATYHESPDGVPPVALTQKDVSRFRIRDAFAVVPIPVGGINVSDEPTPPPGYDCQATSACKMPPGANCERLKDRFLGVLAGIQDEADTLNDKIFNKQTWCENEDLRYTQIIKTLKENLGKQRVNLAMATQEQNIAEKGSYQQSSLHEKEATEYTEYLNNCCKTQNEKKSEMCALEKIRGELLKMEGTEIFITDCVFSEWTVEECSALCGGGIRRKTRQVIVQANAGGVACPPLEASESCNEETCPVDCQLSGWEGWSACSAGCGGGVQERARNILVQPAHNGEPCGATEDERSCHGEDCSEPCKLSEWSAQTGCSAACGGGTHWRIKTILKPATGDGTCPGPEDKERREFFDCNTFDCDIIIPAGRDPQVLNCNSRVDVVILLDGSASLGTNGWKKSKQLAQKLITSLGDGTVDARVALLVFSGPWDRNDLNACRAGTATDLKRQCGMHWIKHFTNNTEELATLSRTLEWPRASTLTSVALGQAESEMLYGRDDANSVVIVITDGKPYSARNTKTAADDLQKKAKLLWVAVGKSAPIEFIQELASEPKREHVIVVDKVRTMAENPVVNRIITATCPVVS